MRVCCGLAWWLATLHCLCADAVAGQRRSVGELARRPAQPGSTGSARADAPSASAFPSLKATASEVTSTAVARVRPQELLADSAVALRVVYDLIPDVALGKVRPEVAELAEKRLHALFHRILQKCDNVSWLQEGTPRHRLVLARMGSVALPAERGQDGAYAHRVNRGRGGKHPACSRTFGQFFHPILRGGVEGAAQSKRGQGIGKPDQPAGFKVVETAKLFMGADSTGTELGRLPNGCGSGFSRAHDCHEGVEQGHAGRARSEPTRVGADASGAVRPDGQVHRLLSLLIKLLR